MPAEESLHTFAYIPLPAPAEGFSLRAVIFANGTLNDPHQTLAAIQPGDTLIAADGGARHCRDLDLTPDMVIGDFDSLSAEELAQLEEAGTQVVCYPARKDFTDLELALQHAAALGADEILVFAALGARWDQTLANLLLPAAPGLEHVCIRLLDGPQEIVLLRAGEAHTLSGQAGDIVSLVPLGGHVYGITTTGLEYPLTDGTLYFGATRGISNVMLDEQATVQLKDGLLLCTLIHEDRFTTTLR
jgi:thiamine pyrophosphokinase